MVIKKVDKENHFVSVFNTKTGEYCRTGIIKDGKDTGEDPFRASFPELIDVGVMGHCTHGKRGLCVEAGVQCYQDGLHIQKPNMPLNEFRRLAKECKGKTFQFALGGRGDVDQHENFQEILECCKENHIVPNFTSSGIGFTEEIVKLCKQYCGAVAISWYRKQHTLDAIQALLKAGVKTNVHYVLGNNSMDEALNRLKRKDFPEGINAVIFLLHKPVGLGKEENVWKLQDGKVREFFHLVDKGDFPFKVGFDSCSVPGIVNCCQKVEPNSIDTCEGGRWSMYVSSDSIAMPCSFDNQELRWGFDLHNHSIQEAWDSPQFHQFRESFRQSCPTCKDRALCMGGCPIRRQIVLCDREERSR